MHLGLSKDVLRRLVQTSRREVRAIMQPLEEKMKDVQRARGSDRGGLSPHNVTLVFWCKSGKHRSVALARMTASALRHLGATVPCCTPLRHPPLSPRCIVRAFCCRVLGAWCLEQTDYAYARSTQTIWQGNLRCFLNIS